MNSKGIRVTLTLSEIFKAIRSVNRGQGAIDRATILIETGAVIDPELHERWRTAQHDYAEECEFRKQTGQIDMGPFRRFASVSREVAEGIDRS